MKTKIKIAIMFLIIIFSGLNQTVRAQSHFEIGKSKDNEMKISGTSTFHDWTMKTAGFSGKATFNIGAENQITKLSAIEFDLPVLTLKSGQKKLDKNAYKALKTDQFKEILYKQVSAEIMSVNNSKFHIKTAGKLTIAGVTKNAVIDLYCFVNKDGSMSCVGNYPINMSDYKVTAPVFMGGVMKTGDAIKLEFSFLFEKS
ncbi:YceI family protein [Flavobacterium sp. KJJ]|uniref:YceI family protein n=1 Tax=Flavobacterium sp. KJJ TaxID=1270193 RepID=UPI0009E92C4B|nr:YceI family protein [Flavobacterium sp. KJJ]